MRRWKPSRSSGRMTRELVAFEDETFGLDEEQIAVLQASIDEANRGELVQLDIVLHGR